MARFLSMRLALIAGSSLGGLAACTSILGDFEVAATNGTTDSGSTDTSIPDSGTDTTTEAAPEAGPTGLSGARQIAAGARHTCALVNLGEIYCWGDNSQGQLGQADGTARSTKPRKVDLIGGVAKQISAGANHTCVVMMSGAIQCWGQNASGESGTGDTTVIAPPHVVRANVAVQPNWALVAAGENHTCAVDEGGQTYCWGANDGKQSGTQAATANPGMANAAGPEKTQYLTLAASNKHTCGAKSGGGNTQCWGSESKGALGNGAPAVETSDLAVNVIFPGEAKQIVAGAGHTCLLDAQGDGRCWGDDAFGQLGIVAAGGLSDAPGAKVGAITLAEIAAGGDTTCGISAQGRILACVGSNTNGQLGRGGAKDTSAHVDPQPVQRNATSGLPLDGVAHVSVGREHVCAIVGLSGEVFCWGNGADGQLGDGTSGGDARTLPVQVALP